MHRLALLSALVFGAHLVGAASVACAQDDEQARELFLQGDRYYSEGRYELAVEAFQESYRLSGRPLLLYNLANAYERLGRYADALDALREYLPVAPTDEQMSVRSRIDVLERRVAETSAAPIEEEAPAASGDESLMTLGYVVGGAGVALTVVGIVMGVLALDARAQAELGCATNDAGATYCDESVRGPLAEDSAFSLVADLGIGFGVAAIAAGVALFLVGLTRETDDSADALTVIPYVAPRAEGAELGVVVPF